MLLFQGTEIPTAVVGAAVLVPLEVGFLFILYCFIFIFVCLFVFVYCSILVIEILAMTDGAAIISLLEESFIYC
jgi:hypothetical protein